ncbi:phosphatase PAP2 family protein [Roseibium sp.]|uniref:phosphatase PAP2 family protein n=1 Tax=Roseibium sp. TaxID=1936156 RepID=UPI003D1054F6
MVYLSFFTSCFLIELISQLRGIEIVYGSFYPFWKLALLFYFASITLFVFGKQIPAMLCECIALVVAFITPVFVSTFLAISMGYPIVDDWLMAADARLGFDWVAYIYEIDKHPLLIDFLKIMYDIFYLLILLVPLLLVVNRDVGRAYGFIFGFGFLCFLSSVISIWFPAKAAFYSYGVLPEDLENMVPLVGYGFLEQFNIAYYGNLTQISIDNLSGILTFPSVHAGVAFWVIWSARRLPFLGVPIGSISFCMAVSAISHGGHYLIDIVAGFGVACLTAIVVWTLFLRERPTLDEYHEPSWKTPQSVLLRTNAQTR